MENILKSLSLVKGEVGKLSKDTTNKFFNSKYFDVNQLLEQVEPLLQKNGLLLLQPITGGKVKSIIYHIESGENVESEIDLGAITDPQKVGSAITYYRRYTLQSLLGLQAEDDDANHASEGSKPKNETSAKKEPENWLNLFTKQGEKTKECLSLEKAVGEGKKFTLAQMREGFKVSKEVAEQLKTNFNIV